MFKSHQNIFLISLCLLLIFTSGGWSQTEAEEKILEDQKDESALEILETLQNLRMNPINLNRVSFDELQSLQIMSSLLVKRIIQDREKNGPYRSFDEMAERLNLDSIQKEKLKPYFKFRKDRPKRDFRINLRARQQKIIQESRGFQTNIYKGSPWKSYQHLAFKYDKLIKGKILIEKDAGEQNWNDHLTGYIQLHLEKNRVRVIVGDFRVESGQGLVFWGPYGLYKGADPIVPVRKKERGIQGSAYATESGYFSGCGLEVKSRWVDFTLIASHAPLDATIRSDGTASSFYMSGLHRTDKELQKRESITETLVGYRLSRSMLLGKIGLTHWMNQYSRKIIKDYMERSRFDFQGTRNHVIGIDWNFSINRLSVTGEAARSRSGGLAWIANGSYDMGACALILSCRDFDDDFQNPHSHCFASSDTQNEKGWYIGFSGRLLPESQINIYSDLYKKPWRTYYTTVPTIGNDLFISWDQKFKSSLRLHFRSRWRRTEELDQGHTNTNLEMVILRERQYQNCRFEINWKQKKKLSMRGRFEFVKVQYPKIQGEISCPTHSEKGFLAYWDCVFQPVAVFKCSFRWVTFQTDSWDSRVYEYERDLPGVLNIPPLYGKGNRWYVMGSVRIGRWFQVHGKFSQTLYQDREEIGSGYDQISGNKKEKLSLQLELKIPK